MKLRQYIDGLTELERADYAKRCGTTLKYLEVHIRYASREPRPALRRALATESGRQVSYEEVLEHFGILVKAA